ncbi:HNH endonuclease [Paracoccus spongiarum]|uniref:Putative HNH nuclease YajD n=1 Tax=Paracoccus spongiarum TaxID=3064387 RepID=A0ABT9J9A2_9RHOB|nr:HNH endonuclease [Paracoccus sp. 2205BS29-5]MDP5306386.1 HNH endonuclease [Paracoccus sp. 2205BS29-5]
MTRFYDTSRWQKCRRTKLSRDPVCEGCEERLAAHVDHIVPVKNGGAVWKPGNWQSLCQGCHNDKTHAERQGKPWVAPKHRGCDEHGNPRDPGHLWNGPRGVQSRETGASHPRPPSKLN